MDKVLAALRALPDGLRGEMTREAVTAGAEVFKREIETTAPRGTKEHKYKQRHIADSIIIYERHQRDILIQAEKDNAIALLVGPSKAAYHGYWIEHGWTATGRARRERKGGGAAHSQRGVEGGTAVPGIGWIDAAYERSKDRAVEAVKAAYRQALERK